MRDSLTCDGERILIFSKILGLTSHNTLKLVKLNPHIEVIVVSERHLSMQLKAGMISRRIADITLEELAENVRAISKYRNDLVVGFAESPNESFERLKRKRAVAFSLAKLNIGAAIALVIGDKWCPEWKADGQRDGTFSGTFRDGTSFSGLSADEVAAKQKSLAAELISERKRSVPLQTAPAGPVASPTPVPSVADELRKLGALRDAHVLTEEEFEIQKWKLLNP